MMGWSPRCYIQSFAEICLPVPEKEIFKGFLPYVGMAAILVMGPASCHQIFISLYLKAFRKKLVQIGKVVTDTDTDSLFDLGLRPITINTKHTKYI